MNVDVEDVVCCSVVCRMLLLLIVDDDQNIREAEQTKNAGPSQPHVMKPSEASKVR